jgi:hypothetical protein
MAEGTVISIDTGTSSIPTAKLQRSESSQDSLTVSFVTKSADGAEKYIVLRPNELYPFSNVDDAALFQALQLLTDCVKVLESAQRIDPDADYIGFDEQMMRARALLRDLFSLRSLGDGFGSVINAVLWSLKNKDTETLTRKQIATLLESVKELKRKPLMHFDTAMSIVDQLEEADLVVEPSMLNDLVDLA